MGLLRQLTSWRHGFWFKVSETLRFSRGIKCEAPALTLSLPDPEQARAAELSARYGVRFEDSLGAKTSRNNYEYLDLLAQGFAAVRIAPPRPLLLTDVGSASFWYAAALAAFFHPGALVGVDIEGHRLFRDWHTRLDYARGYISQIAGAEFVVADYANDPRPADLITAFFPFITAGPVLAWRLPLSVLAPKRLFGRIAANLTPGGLFFMVNHGGEEASLAYDYCSAVGLTRRASWTGQGPFSGDRLKPPVLSWWGHGGSGEPP